MREAYVCSPKSTLCNEEGLWFLSSYVCSSTLSLFPVSFSWEVLALYYVELGFLLISIPMLVAISVNFLEVHCAPNCLVAT